MEYFLVFYLLILNDGFFEPTLLTMANNQKFNSLIECEGFGYQQSELIMKSLNEQGIIFKELMFKCVEEKSQEV